MAVDTFNKFGVCANAGGRTGILCPPRTMMFKEEALVMAAYLVVLSNATEAEFAEVLAAVRNT